MSEFTKGDVITKEQLLNLGEVMTIERPEDSPHLMWVTVGNRSAMLSALPHRDAYSIVETYTNGNIDR